MELQEFREFSQAMTSNDHNVQGTVTLPLHEVDKLRASIVQRDRLIDDLKEKQKKVEITLHTKTIKVKTYPTLSGDELKSETYEDWEKITDHKNLDDIMEGLESAARRHATEIYGNELEKAYKEIDRLNVKLTDSNVKNNSYSQQLEELTKRVEDLEPYENEVEEKEKIINTYKKDFESANRREANLRKQLDDKSWWGRINRFFGI